MTPQHMDALVTAWVPGDLIWSGIAGVCWEVRERVTRRGSRHVRMPGLRLTVAIRAKLLRQDEEDLLLSPKAGEECRLEGLEVHSYTLMDSEGVLYYLLSHYYRNDLKAEEVDPDAAVGVARKWASRFKPRCPSP